MINKAKHGFFIAALVCTVANVNAPSAKITCKNLWDRPVTAHIQSEWVGHNCMAFPGQSCSMELSGGKYDVNVTYVGVGKYGPGVITLCHRPVHTNEKIVVSQDSKCTIKS